MRGKRHGIRDAYLKEALAADERADQTVASLCRRTLAADRQQLHEISSPTSIP